MVISQKQKAYKDIPSNYIFTHSFKSTTSKIGLETTKLNDLFSETWFAPVHFIPETNEEERGWAKM